MSQLTRNRASEILKTLSNRNVLVLGDVMLDEFVWGEVTRISPEAPVPVVDVRRESVHLGGAANVLANLIALGARGVVREATYVDSLKPYAFSSSDPSSVTSLQAALGRAGTYSVEVEHDGYQRWTISGIRVQKQTCGIRTVRLRASLVPTT